jgi:hypothetical protein
MINRTLPIQTFISSSKAGLHLQLVLRSKSGKTIRIVIAELTRR